MQIFLGLTGLLIIGFIMLDIIWTTLGRGGGPVTDKISSWLWKAALSYHQSFPSHRLLSIAGVGVMLVIINIWIFLTWIGWTLIFNMDEQAVIATRSREPADIVSRFYFTGCTLWTLGTGDYQPQGSVWQLATVLATTHGFSLIALSVTFLVPIVSAVTEKRQLATYISCLGRTPEEIILKTWNGTRCRALEQHLTAITPLLVRLEQLYITYPLLHYLHAIKRNDSAAPSIAALDEALTIIEHGIKKECQLEPGVLHPVRQAIWELLKTLNTVFVKSVAKAPPTPTLGRLRVGGIPTVSDENFRSVVVNLDERRKLLLTFVQNDGWFWDDVTGKNTPDLNVT